MRRTLTIAALAIVALGLIVVGYFYFFNGSGGLVAQTGTGANPFGTPSQDTSSGGQGADTTQNTADTPIAGTLIAPHLVKITSSPVAHGVLIINASTTAPVALASTTDATSTDTGPTFRTEVRYIDRQSGNMYTYNVMQGTSVRLTNHTAPGVQETAWLSDGSDAFIRFLTVDPDKTEHIDTYVLPADGTDGRFLARDLSQVLAQGTQTVFTFMPSTSGSVGTISKPDGSGGGTVFTSLLSALHVSFAGTNLLAYTKPSASVNGYAFLIDRKTGAFTKILGPLPGLTALPSPSGKLVLVSSLSGSSLSLSVFDTATHTTIALPVATLTEKCVWSPDNQSAYCAVPTALPSGKLPDGWYQGTIAFSDRLWKIDLIARAATLVANLPELTKEPIDAISLSVDPNESTLTFVNKRDDSLWAYRF